MEQENKNELSGTIILLIAMVLAAVFFGWELVLVLILLLIGNNIEQISKSNKSDKSDKFNHKPE